DRVDSEEQIIYTTAVPTYWIELLSIEICQSRVEFLDCSAAQLTLPDGLALRLIRLPGKSPCLRGNNLPFRGNSRFPGLRSCAEGSRRRRHRRGAHAGLLVVHRDQIEGRLSGKAEVEVGQRPSRLRAGARGWARGAPVLAFSMRLSFVDDLEALKTPPRTVEFIWLGVTRDSVDDVFEAGDGTTAFPKNSR
ncbi:MAG: hypothetical protein BJ554DRAFT_615, partial [Olpidium bornovanus]